MTSRPSHEPTMIRSSYALFNLIKAMCGVGVFALPVAFKQSGLWMGVVLSLALGVVHAHSMIKLVKCSQHLSKKKQCSGDSNTFTITTIAESTSSEKTRHLVSDSPTRNSESRDCRSGTATGKEEAAEENRVALNYGNMAEEAFATRKTQWLRKVAKPTKFAVNLCVIGLQLGMCSAFYIFVVDHVSQIIDYLFTIDLSRLTLFFAILPFFILIATVLPLENKMRRPQDMLGFFGVITISVAFICAVYVTVGFLGYLTYGDDLKGSITLNLTDSPLDFSVKGMLLLMTYCGYLIQHYPIVEMLWPYIQRRSSGASKCTSLMLDYALRYTVVVMSFALAYAIPNFKDIIPFVGITTGMMELAKFEGRKKNAPIDRGRQLLRCPS
ncbi:transmembrane amino acid transporter protein [Ancylostoma ceylanicum]|uniref:Transmembrane amino acid transporter protein n=1 Tax=Ancylostoma ceylanicum TaxID=53326 RepID=A0A0D6LL41_9BILA|nr:transmembrane amino acid transporter protein [Ancylostoma ceylanicum]